MNIVIQQIMLIGTITNPGGLASVEVCGAMVKLTIDGQPRYGLAFNGGGLEAWRDALHQAGQRFHRRLKKVEVPAGQEEGEAWDAVVHRYRRQLVKVLKTKGTTNRRDKNE